MLSSTVTAMAGELLFLGIFGLARRFESQAKPSALAQEEDTWGFALFRLS